MPQASNLKIKSRIVGIDFGMARIGLSVSDEQKIIATPLMTVQAEKKSLQTAFKVINEIKSHAEKNKYTVEAIVIGLPLLMNGKKGSLADEVIHFVDLLKQHTDIPIITWDERLSTVQAERSLRETSLTRKRRSGVVDKVAAVIILQSYLDFRLR